MYDQSSIVHHVYMTKKVVSRLKRPQYRRTYIRQWREYRGHSLEEMAEAIGMTHASLSRVERGLPPYSQAMLEALAEYLMTDVASLIMRDPSDSEAIWSIWDNAKPGDRQKIVDIAKTITGRTGTDGK